MRPLRVLLDRRNRSLEVLYNDSAFEAKDKQLLANDKDNTRRMLVCISCLEHLEWRIERRLASSTIRNKGLCRRNETRSTAWGVMARNFSRVLPRRKTFEMSCSVHGSSSSGGNIGSQTSQSVLIVVDCAPFLGELWSSFGAAVLRKWEFAGRLSWAILSLNGPNSAPAMYWNEFNGKFYLTKQ